MPPPEPIHVVLVLACMVAVVLLALGLLAGAIASNIYIFLKVFLGKELTDTEKAFVKSFMVVWWLCIGALALAAMLGGFRFSITRQRKIMSGQSKLITGYEASIPLAVLGVMCLGAGYITSSVFGGKELTEPGKALAQVFLVLLWAYPIHRLAALVVKTPFLSVDNVTEGPY